MTQQEKEIQELKERIARLEGAVQQLQFAGMRYGSQFFQQPVAPQPNTGTPVVWPLYTVTC